MCQQQQQQQHLSLAQLFSQLFVLRRRTFSTINIIIIALEIVLENPILYDRVDTFHLVVVPTRLLDSVLLFYLFVFPNQEKNNFMHLCNKCTNKCTNKTNKDGVFHEKNKQQQKTLSGTPIFLCDWVLFCHTR